MEEKIKRAVIDFPDFPKKGIVFRDITPLLGDPSLRAEIIQNKCSILKDWNIDKIAAIESRGFWFGSILAHELNLPFIPVRKKGKLPGLTLSQSFNLEYGRETLEIKQGEIGDGDKVLIHDDVLATGGTARAVSELIKKCNATVIGYSFIIELGFLNGVHKLKHYSHNIHKLATY